MQRYQLRNRRFTAPAVCLVMLLALLFARSQAQQTTDVAVDRDDIGGVVAGPNGPESGVWVIAETRGLPVRYIKTVVTDDRGRFLVPDLPQATYTVWARGYGLVDGPTVTSAPGRQVNLIATPAATPAAAAHYYPAIYWYSMLKIPTDAEFASHAGIAAGVSRQTWVATVKNVGCVSCHQLGQLATRTIPPALGTFRSGEQAWMRRVVSGQSGEMMMGLAGSLGPATFKYYGDWTDRIAKGELPRSMPPRPQGVERNIVVTLREWMTERHYLHDLISSDRRYPTVNAFGPLYGSPEYSSDVMPILDPVKNTVTTFRMPVRDANMPLSLGAGHAAALKPMQPSPYWGEEAIWDTRANNHNSMLDREGRLWLSASVRGPDTPAFCRAGSDHPSARLFPTDKTYRHLAMFDPKTSKYTFVDTCFDTHHLQFGYDRDNTLWTSGGGPVIGWLNSRMFLDTGDAAKSQGWSALVLDTNGNGRRDAHVEPNQPLDSARDTRIARGLTGFYAVMPSPVDGSVWGTTLDLDNPGAVLRVVPGSNPPHTTLTEVFNVPAPGFGVRGGDIDRQGVVWVSLGSGHLGSFDRRKCKGPLNGPTATGDHCPEGWAFHRYPGPGFQDIGDNSAESSYYTWVDQHNTFGLGADVPISTGNLNDGFIAFTGGRMVLLRVPYPIGFFAKGIDGRIDDPRAGWKGRGLWTTSGDRTPWLIEGGKGSRPLAAHFQLRPDPLAK